MVKSVSVVVSSYNQPNTLTLSLEGLLHQEWTDFELIVADDGSEEDTHELIDEYSRRAPFPVHFVRQEDRGFRKAKALNNGIRRAEGAYLLLLDGDCIPRPDWITQHVGALTSRYDFSAAGYVLLDLETTRTLTVQTVRDGSLESIVPREQRRRNVRIHWLELFYSLIRKPRKPKIRGGNWAVTRRAMESVNGFDENFDGFSKEDSDIRNRLVVAGFKGRSLWDRNWVIHCDHELDPRRTSPDVVRAPPNRDYYDRPVCAPRCCYGLVDERETVS